MVTESREQGCVLVADDDAAVLRTTTRLLKRLGYSVVPVPTGTEAVVWLDRDDSDPVAVIVDHSLGDLPGPQLVDEIRRLYPGLPTLIVSGLDETTALRAYDEPRPAFLPKPYNLKKLTETLARIL